ncbi:unnamed protein product [Coregonus sp. 'balchen']|nr:unnamed protein product [Coregonus sp. 'balchen']
MMVWAFGDGDYGKLGLGNSTAKSSPGSTVFDFSFPPRKCTCVMSVPHLFWVWTVFSQFEEGKGKDVTLRFSVALTKDGNVYTFGQDRLIGLPEGRARNHNRPQVVPALSDVFIEDVAVGAEHTLVLSSTGEVYTWGSNSEGQVGYNTRAHTHTHTHTGTGTHTGPLLHWRGLYLGQQLRGTVGLWAHKPRVCEESHPGSSPRSLQIGLPVAVPPQFSCLREVSMEAVRARLRILYHFSDLMYSSWRLLNLSPNNQSCASHYNTGTWGIVQGQLRPLLAPRVYTLPMVRSIGKTMVQGKNYGPQITGPSVVRIEMSSDLRLPSRAWKVKLVGEGADDDGGRV